MAYKILRNNKILHETRGVEQAIGSATATQSPLPAPASQPPPAPHISEPSVAAIRLRPGNHTFTMDVAGHPGGGYTGRARR